MIRTPEPIAVNATEAARLIGVSPRQMYELLSSGQVESRYMGRKRLVPYASLKAYVEGLPQDGPGAA